MIGRQEVMPRLLAACPSFHTAWEEHLQSWGGEEAGLYNDLGELALHLVKLFKQEITEEFNSVFEVVELLHTDGDDYVQEAITVGLLEDLQNLGANSGFNPAVFVRYLKPESLKWWNKLNDFWLGN